MSVSMPDPTDIDFGEFLARARTVLDGVEKELSEGAIDRVLVRGMWHPNGFAVFNIRDVPGLGIVRLHFWPENLREELRGHPTVHRHCFHLLSRVISGTYSELVYSVSEYTGEKNGDSALMNGYRVIPPIGDGVDRIVPDCKTYLTQPASKVRTCSISESHSLPAGRYHETTIPKSSSCITLAVFSRPIFGWSDHLVGGTEMESLNNRRVSVGMEVVDRLRETLLSRGCA